MLLVGLGLVLTVQVLREVFMAELPANIAVTLAPTSPTVLRRAAEAEFERGRLQQADQLARQALARGPFDVRALRVAGLVEAQSGDLNRADELLTLAGNWSLRDGATHLWLMERRLRQGRYGDAFAHGDTLLRRRGQVQPQIFTVFEQAGAAHPQAFAALVRLLASSPPWRSAYFASLSQTPERQPLAAALAMALGVQRGAALGPSERATLYTGLAGSQSYQLLRRVSAALEPADSGTGAVIDGAFSGVEPLGPLGWSLGAGAGLTSELLVAPGGDNPALHVLSDGYSSGVAASQLMLRAPGSYVFEARSRISQGQPGEQLRWTITCAPTGAILMSLPLPASAEDAWTPLQRRFEVPSVGCEAQSLALRIDVGERRRTLEVWADDVGVRAASR